MNSDYNSSNYTAVILAAGESQRFGEPKLLVKLGKFSVVSWALKTPLSLNLKVLLILPRLKDLREEILRILREELETSELERIEFSIGGATRQESSRIGVLSVRTKYVLIHDAARPFATQKLYERVMKALAQGYRAVLPVIKAYDTVRLLRGGSLEILPRDDVLLAQTPQGFLTSAIREAHMRAEELRKEFTDDISLLEWRGERPYLLEGELTNMKLTYKELLPAFQGLADIGEKLLRGDLG